MTTRTQVGIVGAGPAGLMLGHLLHLLGIDSVILEIRSGGTRDRARSRRVLEQGSVDLLTESGVGERLSREGMRHGGIYVAFSGRRHRIDFEELTGGRSITIYGQNEVVRDLMSARAATGEPLLFDVSEVKVRRSNRRGRGYSSATATASRASSRATSLPAATVSMASAARPFRRRVFTPTSGPIRSRGSAFSPMRHPRPTKWSIACTTAAFALFSMRSPQVTRLYLQCAPDENIEAGATSASGPSCASASRPTMDGVPTKAPLRSAA